MYGINVSAFISISGGADVHSETYKVETPDQGSYFVKIKQGVHHEHNIALQTLLHDAGINHIIAPIKTINGKAFHLIKDCTLIVYPFIKAQDGFNCNLTKDQWINLGKVLKQVQTFGVPLPIKTQLRQETYSPKWRSAVRSMLEQIETVKNDDAIASAMINFIKEHKDEISRLVETADTLSDAVQKKDQDFVLCHSDIHAGNVLVNDDGNLFIVDWDEPIMAQKERDLMFVGGGVGNVWHDQKEVEHFYQGYGRTNIDKDLISYYRCNRILEDIAIYYEQLVSPDNENRKEAYQFLVDMFEPNGVVDIALG